MTLTTGLSGKHGGRERRAVRKAGFTLLELILVMLIVAIVLSIAAPSLRMFANARPVANAAAQFVALTDYARSQAISEGRTYRLNLDPDKGLFWLTAQEGGAFQPLEREFGRVFSLPEGTKVDWLDPPAVSTGITVPGLRLSGQTDNTPDAAGTAARTSIAFYPDGHTETSNLRLTDRRGNTLSIVCFSPTDRFRVVAAKGLLNNKGDNT